MSRSSRSFDELVAEVAAAYFSAKPTPAEEVDEVIARIGESLKAFADPNAAPAAVEAPNLVNHRGPPTPRPTPEQIRQSVTAEAIISFEDGRPYRMLRRHLRSRGLTPQQYRLKWGLPPDYPMAAPSLSAKRSALGKRSKASESENFLAIGPIRASDAAAIAERLEPLKEALAERLGPGRCVEITGEGLAPSSFRFSLAVGVPAAEGARNAALTLREEPSHAVLAVFRARLAVEIDEAEARALAEAVAEAIWTRVALAGSELPVPTDMPLHMRMHAAAVLLDPPGAVWRTHAEQLSRLRNEGRSNPTIEIMWAMHLFARMTLDLNSAPLDRDSLKARWAEIERLVMENLDAAREDPILALAAAKLLFMAGPGREPLAEEMARTAFESSTAFAAALPTIAQIKAGLGDLDEALRLYDEALLFCEEGSLFELYLMIVKSIALIAAGRWPEVEALFERAVEIDPTVYRNVGLLFLPPGDDGLAARLAPLVQAVPQSLAGQLLAYLYCFHARHLHVPHHCANLMRGPLTRMVRKFGPDVVPQTLWRELPAELHILRGEPSAAAN